MSNSGKFADRFPNIRTAGRRYPLPTDGVQACMTFPSTITDIAECIARALPKKPFEGCGRKEPPPNDTVYRHYNTNVKDILEADYKTGFESFRAELRETAYKSYWRDEVGKIPDQVPNLPIGMDPENTTFGSAPVERITAAELINPKKCRALIEYESSVGHDLYCTSHNSYEPGEQKRTIPVPKNMVFGKKNVIDNTGGHVKTLLQWIDQSVISMTSRSMAEYKDLLYYPLGKGRVRTGVPAGITIETTFGKPSNHGHVQIMKDRDKMLPLLVAYLHNAKAAAKKAELDLKVLQTVMTSADRNRTKCLPAKIVYEIVAEFGLNLDREMMDQVLLCLNMMSPSDRTICYKRFVDLLNFRQPLPDFGKFSHPEDASTYLTNYMELCADLEKKQFYDSMSTAGSPAFRADSSSIGLPFGPGWCLANLEDIPMQTTVDDVLRPHIFTHYGLSIYDIFKPRSKDFIKDIFIKKVGLEIPDNVFEIIWQEGIRRDGVMSVETFRNILSEISTAKLEQMADTTIHDE